MNFIFDVDDTLYDQMDTFERAYDAVFEKRELPMEKLFVRSRARSDEVFNMVATGVLPKEEMYTYRICKAFEDCGSSLSKAKGMDFQRAYQAEQGRIVLLPTVVDILNYLKAAKATMGIITNGPEDHQRKKVETLGLDRWFKPEEIFISGAMGVAKPERAAFKKAEEAMGLNPEDTLYIGDAFHIDVVGAKGAGWKSLWMNRRNNPMPEAGGAMPDFTVRDDDALFKLIMTMV